MEPRAQNAHLLPFFYYDTIKLTKNDYFYPKSMEQCSKKSAFFQSFFSVPKMVPTKFLQSLRDLQCWIANRLEYTNP